MRKKRVNINKPITEKTNNKGYSKINTIYGEAYKFESPEGLLNFCKDWDNGKINKDY